MSDISYRWVAARTRRRIAFSQLRITIDTIDRVISRSKREEEERGREERKREKDSRRGSGMVLEDRGLEWLAMKPLIKGTYCH